jgi:hypothetical protein
MALCQLHTTAWFCDDVFLLAAGLQQHRASAKRARQPAEYPLCGAAPPTLLIAPQILIKAYSSFEIGTCVAERMSSRLHPGETVDDRCGPLQYINGDDLLQMDDVLGQAQAVAGGLGEQRRIFDNVGLKLENVAARFPLVSGLLNAIRRKKNKVGLLACLHAIGLS